MQFPRSASFFLATTLAFCSSTASAPQATAPTGPADTRAAASAEDDSVTLQAREAFRLGSWLAKEGQWNEALAAFERSAHLRAHPVTTYNIGYVERALGHYTRAQRSLNRALAEKAAGTGATLPESLVTAARGYLADIDQRLAQVSVDIAEQPPRKPYRTPPGGT